MPRKPVKRTAKPPRFRLITNIREVQILPFSLASGNLYVQPRLFCSALLLEHDDSNIRAYENGIRGFGVDPGLCVFMFQLNCGHLKYTPADEPGEQWTLHFSDGTVVQILRADPKKPLDVVDYRTIQPVWMALTMKAHRYWGHDPWPLVRFTRL